MSKNTCSPLVFASCLLLLSEFPSFGQALQGSSLDVTGTGAINTLVSGTAAITSGSIGSLVVGGTADVVGNTLYFGSWSADPTHPGYSIFYSDGVAGTNSGLTQTLTRPQAVWNWQRIATSGSAVNVMQIDASNRLILTGTDSSQQIVMDPNGTIFVNGSNLLTQDVADSRYFLAGIGLTSLNGKIGIGTVTPAVALDVWGSLNVSSGSSSALFVDSSSGYVGIGTATPSAKLDIKGTLNAGDRVNLGLSAPGTAFHAGSSGVMFRPSSSDRAIMELHSPSNNTRGVIQAVDNYGIFIQSLTSLPTIFDQNYAGSYVQIAGSSVSRGLRFSNACAGANDIGLGRASAGVLQVTDGNTGLGTLIAGNSRISGTLSVSDTNNAGRYAVSYTDGTNGIGSNILQITSRPSTSWTWQRTAATGTSVNVMQIDAANRLVLTGTDSTKQLVLDPNGNTALNSNNILTKASADSLYISSAAGLTISGGNVGIGSVNPSGQLQISISDASNVGEIIKSNPLQAVDLMQLQDAYGSLLAKIDLKGAGYFGLQTEYPAIICDSDNGSNITWKNPYTSYSARLNQRGNGEIVYSANINDYDMLDDTSLTSFKFALWMELGKVNFQYSPAGSSYWDGHEVFATDLNTGNTYFTANFGVGVSGGYMPYPTHLFEVGLYGANAWIDTNQAYFSGNVGVGTATPLAKLDVDGNARFSGAVRIEPQGDLDMGAFTVEPTTAQVSQNNAVKAASTTASVSSTTATSGTSVSGTTRATTSGTNF